MTPRMRRGLAMAVLIAAALFIGRWSVNFVALRWWAASISPEAVATVTRHQLTGLLVPAVAILLGTAWFLPQIMMLFRTLPTPPRMWQSMGLSFLISTVHTWIVASQAGGWQARLLLGSQSLRYGEVDPLLGEDLGRLIAGLPVYELVNHYLATLVLLTLGMAVVVHATSGALQFSGRRLRVTPSARNQLGSLLAVFAVSLALGYLLDPMRLATSATPPLADGAGQVRVLASMAMVGLACATAILTFVWWRKALRGSILAATWTVLAMGAVVEWLIVPSFTAVAISRDEFNLAARGMDARFHGIELTVQPSQVDDSLPAFPVVRSDDLFLRAAAHAGNRLLTATLEPREDGPEWLTITAIPGSEQVSVAHVPASSLSPGSAKIPLDDWRQLAVVRPDTAGWTVVPRGGVALGPIWRRVVLAWALQAPQLLGMPPESRIDWNLSPAERSARLIPELDWVLDGAKIVNGNLQWLLTGYAVTPRAPLATRIEWLGREVAGVEPALIAQIDAATGQPGFWRHPAADSLGMAWARAHHTLVSAGGGPAVHYPVRWFEAQLAVLEGEHGWALGRRLGAVSPDGPPGPAMLSWRNGEVVPQAGLGNPGNGRLGRMVAGSATQWALAVQPVDSFAPPAQHELVERWAADPDLRRLRDSVRASGDSVWADGLRHQQGPAGLAAWQGWFAPADGGRARLVWLSTALGSKIGGGRSGLMAWNTVRHDPEAELVIREVIAEERLENALLWLERADSALRRGDLTAFGRAWEALRAELAASSENPP